jgi:hypothetical protein
MNNKEKFGAKAQCFWCLTYPGINAGVIDNETFMDFSPKFIFWLNSKITAIRK